jgi:hypothetical protein
VRELLALVEAELDYLTLAVGQVPNPVSEKRAMIQIVVTGQLEKGTPVPVARQGWFPFVRLPEPIIPAMGRDIFEVDNGRAAGSAAAKPVGAAADTVSNSSLDHELRVGLKADAPGRVEPVGCLNQANGAAGDEIVNLKAARAPRGAQVLRHSSDKRKVVRD